MISCFIAEYASISSISSEDILNRRKLQSRDLTLVPLGSPPGEGISQFSHIKRKSMIRLVSQMRLSSWGRNLPIYWSISHHLVVVVTNSGQVMLHHTPPPLGGTGLDAHFDISIFFFTKIIYIQRLAIWGWFLSNIEWIFWLWLIPSPWGRCGNQSGITWPLSQNGHLQWRHPEFPEAEHNPKSLWRSLTAAAACDSPHSESHSGEAF